MTISMLALASTACGSEEAQPVPPDLLDGEALFRLRAAGGEAGCVTCHSTDPDHVIVGPSLAGLGGRAAIRVPGLDAETYLRQSIVDPRAFSVEGFDPDKMPTGFVEAFSDAQIDALVDYLGGL